MAVVVIVEDGSIVENANSYISVEFADEYLSLDPRLGPAWDALTSAEDADPDPQLKEKMVIFATRWLDENFIWHGKRVSSEQSLAWPRKGMFDGEYPVPETTIPLLLKRATAQVAVWLYANDPNGSDETLGVKRFRNEEIEIEWQDSFNQTSVPVWLLRLLRVFGYGPGDRGFKPITRVN